MLVFAFLCLGIGFSDLPTDGVYVTTRGCSVDYRWEDVRGYQQVRGGEVPCIRRAGKETCLCTTDRCNPAPVLPALSSVLPFLLLTAWLL